MAQRLSQWRGYNANHDGNGIKRSIFRSSMLTDTEATEEWGEGATLFPKPRGFVVSFTLVID